MDNDIDKTLDDILENLNGLGERHNKVVRKVNELIKYIKDVEFMAIAIAHLAGMQPDRVHEVKKQFLEQYRLSKRELN